jgi:hypothetical protein
VYITNKQYWDLNVYCINDKRIVKRVSWFASFSSYSFHYFIQSVTDIVNAYSMPKRMRTVTVTV